MKTPLRTRHLPILFVAMLLLVGCSTPAQTAPASADAPSTPAPGSSAAEPTPGGTATPVDVIELEFGLASVNMFYPAYMVAEDLGIFEKHGVRPNLFLGSVGATAVQGLVTESLHVAAISTDSNVTVHADAPELAAIMKVTDKVPYSLIVSDGIETVEDLLGMQLGASAVNAGDGSILQMMLAEHGLEAETDYSIVLSGDPAARTAALQAGAISGLVIGEPQATLLKNQGYTELLRSSDNAQLGQYPFLHLVVNREWADANREVVVRFLAAWGEATRIVYDPERKDEVISIIAEYLELDEEVVAAGFESWVEDQEVYPLDAAPDADSVQTVIDTMLQFGQIEEPGPDAEALIDASYWEEASERISE